MSGTPDPVVAELVERACFSWLRSLFPVQASDDEIRSRIKDTDRQHVGYILVSSGIVAQLTALAERVARYETAMLGTLRQAAKMRAAIERHDRFNREDLGYSSPDDPALDPSCADDWRQLRAALTGEK